MDDESSGIGAGAAYLLGRMAAERSQEQDELIARFTARIRRPAPTPVRRSYDADEVHEVIDGWKAAVRSREETIQELRTVNEAVAAESGHWRARAEALKAEAEEMRAAYVALQQKAAVAEEAWRDAGHERDMADLALCVARMDLAQMKEEVERLKGGGS